MIVGDEVPHVHLHVVPFDSVSELSFANADPNPPEGSLDAAAAEDPRRAARPRGRLRVGVGSARWAAHDEWVARDAAVVWHGFTQMAAYAENAPIIVERGEGHELIDVDGRRYLDAISSLWVNTLGHHVPELDDAVRDAARPRRALDDARQRQPRGGRAGRGARPASCRSTTRTSSSRPTARRRSSRR